jgi:hypothetical protein
MQGIALALARLPAIVGIFPLGDALPGLWRLTSRVMSRMNDQQARDNAIKSIQEAAALLFGLPVEALTGESTKRSVAVPRNIAVYNQTID